jgi:16S rRNA (guanine(966)-N(2))-methyltransferase RsmD
MRIIGGSARGRRLLPPRARGIRPTADRVRETLFNVLGQAFQGQEVLDLFAGTGALGLEALSRGARSAVLVDSNPHAVQLCKENARLLGFADRVRIMAATVPRALAALRDGQANFDLIFADPPYASKAVEETVAGVSSAALLKPGGAFCIEHDKREGAPARAGDLHLEDQRRFGDTLISIYRVP